MQLKKNMGLSASFHGELDILESINLSESHKSNGSLPDLSFFSSSVIHDSQSQMTQKANVFEDVTV